MVAKGPIKMLFHFDSKVMILSICAKNISKSTLAYKSVNSHKIIKRMRFLKPSEKNTMDLNGAQWELRFLNFILFVFS
jgi:hypothetical protein